MSTKYFTFTRKEIKPLLPAKVNKIVDVGCGAGSTSIWLKSLFPNARTIGLEGNAALRSELSQNLDEIYIVDLNGDLPAIESPDLVLFLDVLEHLHSPESVLKQILKTLPEDGHVIVSLPNVAHLSVAAPLLFKGQFEYKDAGILDRTHVRFFVRSSAIKMLNDAGLRVLKGLEAGFDGPKSKLLDRLTFGLLRDRLSKQYILKATRMAAGQTQGPIEWQLAG